MMNKNQAKVRQILAAIETRSVDLDQLFLQFEDVWADLYLDELAMVVVDEKLAPIDIFSGQYYRVLSEYSPMMSPAQISQLLAHAWLPKLEQALTDWSSRQEDIFALIQMSELEPIRAEISRELIPYALQSNDIRWAVLLECDFDQTVELCCDTVAQCAPKIPAAIRHVQHAPKVLKLCLMVWAATATAEQLASIRPAKWLDWGLSQNDTSAVLAAALGSSWPVPDMAARYRAVRDLEVGDLAMEPPCLELRRAMLFTLNYINAAMDRSGDVPAVHRPRSRVLSLAELLEQWCGARDIGCVKISGTTYTVGAKKTQVDLREGVFWIDGSPHALEELGTLC